MSSKAISELDAIKKIEDDDLIIVSKRANSDYDSAKITGSNLKSDILKKVQIEQSLTEGVEIASIKVDGKKVPIYAPENEGSGDTIFPLVGDNGTQIARISRPNDNDFYLRAPTTSFSSNMSDGVLLGTILADGVSSNMYCPVGITTEEVEESCKDAIRSQVIYNDSTSELFINGKSFKVSGLTASGIKQQCEDAISDAVTFDDETSTLTIGDDSLKVPNLDSNGLNSLIDNSITRNTNPLKGIVKSGISESGTDIADAVKDAIDDKLSDIKGSVKTAIDEKSEDLQEIVESGISGSMSVDSDTNNFTIGNDTIYVSKLTQNDVKGAITDKISADSTNNRLTIGDNTINVGTSTLSISDIQDAISGSMLCLNIDNMNANTFYKGKIQNLPAAICSKTSGNPTTYTITFASKSYIKLNLTIDSGCGYASYVGFKNTNGVLYKIGEASTGGVTYTFEGYVKNGTVMVVSFHYSHESTTNSIIMYPVI